MKFNEDLFRDILLHTELIPATSRVRGEQFVNEIQEKYDDIEPNDIKEHIRLTVEAGLVEAMIAIRNAAGALKVRQVSRLTYEGHQFLAKINDDTTWRKMKDLFKRAGSSLSIKIIDTLSDEFITELLTD